MPYLDLPDSLRAAGHRRERSRRSLPVTPSLTELPLRGSAVLLAAGALVAWGALGCARDDDCLGGSAASPARLEACQALCEQGNQGACDRRSEVEGKLSTACHKRSNKAACRAICHGRRSDQRACDKLRSLP